LLKSLLVGDNAFIGVSHLSNERARQRLQQLSFEAIVEVIGEAMAHGATGFSFSTHPTNFTILRALSDRGILGPAIEIYPILPYAAGYVRTLNEKGPSGLISEITSRLSLSDKAKFLYKSGASAVSLDPAKMFGAYVDMELTAILGLARSNLRAVFLHEIITDLGVSLQAAHLVDYYMRHVRDEYHVKPGFVTRNLVRFVKFFEDFGLSLKDTVIMTPVNRAGFQMNPSKESCELCLSHIQDSDVIAMSILAGGYLTLDEAVEYLRSLPNLSGIVVGVSSKEHAEKTFTRLRTLI
jgi:hypothetical protein